jgi:large subunit ribosomal protein L25
MVGKKTGSENTVQRERTLLVESSDNQGGGHVTTFMKSSSTALCLLSTCLPLHHSVSSTMATRYRSVAQLRRQLPLLDRFIIREGRAQELESNLRHPVNPSPFLPHKNEATGRWMPPRLSLRRQAQLGKEAYKQGRFEELTEIVREIGTTPGVKLGKMKERIDAMAEVQKKGVTVPVSAPPSTLASSSSLKSGDLEEATLKKSLKQIRLENDRRAVVHAKALAATRGPYSGRSLRNIFKGTKAERDAPARKQRTAEKLLTMEQTIQAWRKVSFTFMCACFMDKSTNASSLCRNGQSRGIDRESMHPSDVAMTFTLWSTAY